MNRQLEALILDDQFTSLQNKARDEVNLMELLGIAHKELQHSNILAWLFDPKGSHGLDDFFIKEFIKLYYKANNYNSLGEGKDGMSVFEFVNLDFDDIIIRREDRNVDILILSHQNKLVISIENKVFSREHSNQLQKYRKQIEKDYKDFNHKIYIFLSLYPQDISDESYISIAYDTVLEIINKTIQSESIHVNDSVQFVLRQYSSTIRSLMGDNEELEKLSRDLYKKYKNAFDTVFKYVKPGKNQVIPNNLEELILESPRTRQFVSNKYYIRFQPEFLYENKQELIQKGFLSEGDLLKDNWLLYFEFNVTPYYINFNFKIGEHYNAEQRQALYDHLMNNTDIFLKVAKRNGELRGKWHQAYQKKIISKREYTRSINEDSFELQPLIDKRFKELVTIDLPKIKKGLVDR